MRKTTIILLLTIQIVLLFFFENIHSFMDVLKSKELKITKENLLIKARYSILKNGSDIRVIKKEDGFEFVAISKVFRKEPIEEQIDNEKYYTFDIKSDSGTVLRFREKLDSPFSDTIKKLKGLISAFIILLGIFVLITGIYLVILFKRGKKEEPSGLPLLQDYLTKLKESETELKGIVDEQRVNVKKSEEISGKVINRISAAIILLNEKGRIELFNPFAEKIFSKSSSFAINNSPDEVFNKFPEITDFIKKKPDSPIAESIVSKNSIFLVEILPISPVGSLVIIRDITEEKKREELLNSRKNFMMLGEMTTFLTHEIRNSLGVIFGYSKTFKSEPEKTKKINSEIIFLTEMMENFLNFSKPLSMTRIEEVNTAELISSICSENGLSAKISGDSSGSFKSDPNLIRSVFTNLVLNAKEAGAGIIKANFTNAGDKMVKLEIQDDGKGIQDADLDKVWYPFYTSKSKGTGMGLAIVKKIVNFLNGEINIIKSDKKGTMFRLTFYSSSDQI